MKTLAIISHKGGAGKTTSAVMLAEDLARRGVRVVLVDADRQRGASLILGLEETTGSVQQTRNPRLRYLCSSVLPLRELPSKVKELEGLFDVAVVDTPSLDDPLARGWIQLSTAVLMVIPVEPVSLKTLDGAEAALDNVRDLSPQIHLIGVLPTMFDEQDPTQRTLMLELRSRRPDGLLNPPIPTDSGLAHRAEQKVERRTEPSEQSRAAYQAAGDAVVRGLQLDGMYGGNSAGASAWAPPARRAQPMGASVPAAPVQAGSQQMPMPQSGGFKLNWAVAAIAVLVLLAAGIGYWMTAGRGGRASDGPAKNGKSRVIAAKSGSAAHR